MATRLRKWFAKNSMQHNHDETDMPGMPETPGGRSWQMATGEALHATMLLRLMTLMMESSQTHRVEG